MSNSLLRLEAVPIVTPAAKYRNSKFKGTNMPPNASIQLCLIMSLKKKNLFDCILKNEPSKN